MTDIKEQAYGKPPIGFDTGRVVYPSVSSCMTVSVISTNGISGAHFGIMDGHNKITLGDLTSLTKQTLQLPETKGGSVECILVISERDAWPSDLIVPIEKLLYEYAVKHCKGNIETIPLNKRTGDIEVLITDQKYSLARTRIKSNCIPINISQGRPDEPFEVIEVDRRQRVELRVEGPSRGTGSPSACCDSTSMRASLLRHKAASDPYSSCRFWRLSH